MRIRAYCSVYRKIILFSFQVFPDVTTNGKVPYGSFLTCSSDGTVRVWNIETGLLLRILLKACMISQFLFGFWLISFFPFRQQNGTIQKHLQQGIRQFFYEISTLPSWPTLVFHQQLFLKIFLVKKELVQVIYTEKDLANLKDTKSHTGMLSWQGLALLYSGLLVWCYALSARILGKDWEDECSGAISSCAFRNVDTLGVGRFNSISQLHLFTNIQ